jgi:short-subunit dehydrogenase
MIGHKTWSSGIDMPQTTTIGLYLVAKWAIPKLQAVAKSSPQAKPSLLVTGGFLHLDPEPDLFSLSLVKTAQRNLVQSLHKAYNSQGIHVGLVLVGGIVSPEAKVLNPTNIAKVAWDFFNREPADWDLEVSILDV